MGQLHPTVVLWAPFVGHPAPLFVMTLLSAEPTLVVLSIITGGPEISPLGWSPLPGRAVLASFLPMVVWPEGWPC
jgi:hypothetical protein